MSADDEEEDSEEASNDDHENNEKDGNRITKDLSNSKHHERPNSLRSRRRLVRQDMVDLGRGYLHSSSEPSKSKSSFSSTENSSFKSSSLHVDDGRY